MRSISPMIRRRCRFGPVFLFLAFVAAPATAAQQGEIASTSTGSVGIAASVAARAQVAGLADTALASNGTATTVQRVCIRLNSATQLYSIAGTSDAPDGRFVLANGAGESVPLSLAWSSEMSGGGIVQQPLQPGTSTTALTGDCTSGTNAALTINTTSADATGPWYGATTLTIAPL